MFNISLGMIVRNEGRTLRACLESVAPHVDEIVIGLGGESTDDTEAIAREFTDKVIQLEWEDDFSKARNQVLEAVKGDYFFWLDGDDILIGGENLRRLVRSYPNVDVFYAGYDYARDKEDNCICYLVRERLIRLHDQLPNRGWQWVGKVHEVMLPVVEWDREERQVTDFVVQHHKPAGKHDIDRNLDILYSQLQAQEPNPDPRILGYLCSEQGNRGNFREAIAYGQRFIKLSGWREEKYQMQHRIADMYRLMGEYGKAVEADTHAIQICPEWPDAWMGLAETYGALENWPAVVETLKAAGTKEPPQTMLITNPLDYSYSPFVLLAAAQAHLGDWESALDNYSRANSVKSSPQLEEQIRLIKEEIRLQAVVTSFLTIREQLGRNDEWLKVRRLYDVVPKHVEHHPAIMGSWERSMKQTEHIVNPAAMAEFYEGNPQWTPMADETILDPGWLNYPRLKFAIDTARRLQAKNVVDWGCSDGFISLPVARELGIHVTGFDIDPRCVDLATLRAKKWGLDARFETGSTDEIGRWEGDKADLALFFETIEHVVDPAQTLERLELTADHIALTTPYLSWERGHIPAWDRVEPKGHLRIFDQFDLERILAPRGRIWNLYREPWGQDGKGGWLFADYAVGKTTDKTVIIGAMGAPEPWNPRAFTEGGLGGSETAVLQLANAFTKQGHQAIVYSTINEPGYYDGACYRPAEHFRPEIKSDLYIAWRDPTPADWAIDTKCLVLWLHDVDAGDRLTPERARRFDAIVVLSEWHKNHVLKTYPFLKAEQLVVIGNGVDPERFNKKVKRDSKRVIYSSSPDRGLDIILEKIWPKVLETVPDAELHVYYGWNTVDKFISQRPDLQQFKYKILSAIANTKNVTQHGRVNQDKLAKAFLKSSVWLYPTYFTETYCITAVEAQLGGAIPITNHLAALAETVSSGIVIEGDVNDPEVQDQYVKAVVKALMTPLSERQELHEKVRQNAPAQTWDQVGQQWQNFLRVEN